MTQRVTSVYNMRQAGFSPDPPVTGHGEEGIKTECMSKTCRPKEFTKTQALGEFQNQIQPMWRTLGQGKRFLSLQEKPEQTGKGEPAERVGGGAVPFHPWLRASTAWETVLDRQSQPALAQRATEPPERGLLCKAPWPARSRQPSLYLLGQSIGPSEPKRKPTAVVPSFLPVSSVPYRSLYVEDSCSSSTFPEGLYDALVHNEHKDTHHPVPLKPSAAHPEVLVPRSLVLGLI